jgi:hypothetical protein
MMIDETCIVLSVAFVSIAWCLGRDGVFFGIA